MATAVPPRPRSTLFTTVVLWFAFYASFTLFRPPLLDDADSVHAEVAREMLLRHDPVTLYANGIRYLEKAPLLYWLMALFMRAAGVFGAHRPELLAAVARVPLALSVLALVLLAESFARRVFCSARAGLYASLILLSSFGIFIFTRITIPDSLVCLWVTASLYAFWRTEEVASARLVGDGARVVIDGLPLGRAGGLRISPLRFAPVEMTGEGNSVERTGEGNSVEMMGGEGHSESFRQPTEQVPRADRLTGSPVRRFCWLFAASCALNVLTKGLIGVVFPVGIVLIYLVLTRGFRRAAGRLRRLHPLSSLAIFLLIAAPWHVAAGVANPSQGHPAPFRLVRDASSILPWGHWQIPLPTDGNVRGWWWFYFMNEHLLRYLNLRVPRDYDTVPLALFWGLCLLWLMPWSAFAFKATSWAVPLRSDKWLRQFGRHDLPLQRRGRLLLVLWAAFVLVFFSLSTRQEYYILPALPGAAVLIGGWLAYRAVDARIADAHRQAGRRITALLAAMGVLAAGASLFFMLHTRAPAPNTDLAQLLQQNPGEYALSFGHFLDLNGQAMGMFRLPLALTVLAFGLGFPLAWYLRTRREVHLSNLMLAAATFLFLLAAHLGLQIFAPVLSSAQLAEAIRPQLRPDDLIVLHGEYEAGSTLAFYLGRPTGYSAGSRRAQNPIHILEGRSSNLWYGSFFRDAPPLFETPASLAAKWSGPQRIFLWQSLTDPPNALPPLPGPAFVLARSGGKEIVSNRE